MTRPLAVTRFDPADYLKSNEAVAEYLTAALETGDAAFIADAIGVAARQPVAEVIGRASADRQGVDAVAVPVTDVHDVVRETGLSRESLYRALSTGGNPEFATVLRVVQAFGLRLEARPLQRDASSPEHGGPDAAA